MRSEITNFDKRLTEKMTELGISQADLCRLTGLASSMVSHYCTGQRMPSIPVAIKIARVLNTTVDYLAYGNYTQLQETANDNFIIAENEVRYKAKPVLYECDINEQSIINNFRSLNEEGQSKIIDYIDDIISTEKYQH